MRDAEAAITSAFYDHEQELARDREDRADDWGADAVFASGPRRRLGRRPVEAEGQIRRHPGARPARGAGFERRASGPVAAPVADPWLDRDPPSAEDTTAAVPVPAALTTGLEWSPDGSLDEAAGMTPAPVEPHVAAALRDWVEPANPGGRRTIVVTGRPGMVAAAPSPRPLANGRRRPRRRSVEHLGARPDRVAGWAFGLGMLLIVVAVGTADAAPL